MDASPEPDPPTSSKRPEQAPSAFPAWMTLAVVLGAIAMGVVWFLGRLPEPPRYDDLRVDPGSTARPIRAIRLGLVIDGELRSAPVENVGFDTIDPLMSEAGRATGGRYRIPVLPKEAGPAIFGVETTDLRVSILQDDRVLLEVGGDGENRLETDPILVPTRASDIILTFDVVGPSPSLVAWWRVPDGSPRPFASLARPSRDSNSATPEGETPAP